MVQYIFTVFWPLVHWTTNYGSVYFCCILTIGSLDYKLWFSIFLLYFDHWFIGLQTMVQYIFCCILTIGLLDYKLWFSIFFTVF